MSRIPVCRVDELPEGESCVLTVGECDIALFHSEGKFYAINDRCPHAGSPLSGGHVEGGIVTCPWHGWRFRLSDGAWADNPKVKTECYRVHVENGMVSIDTTPNA